MSEQCLQGGQRLLHKVGILLSEGGGGWQGGDHLKFRSVGFSASSFMNLLLTLAPSLSLCGPQIDFL
jgi:hypothetical protein